MTSALDNDGPDFGAADQDSPLPPSATTTVTVLICMQGSATVAAGGTAESSRVVKLSAVARIPRRRDGLDDPVTHELQHFSFLDDRNGFGNVDALLTRLAPVGCVYVACTDAADGGASAGGKAGRGAKRVRDLVDRLIHVVETRGDAAADGADGITVRAVASAFSKSKARELAASSLRHLLGGESSEAHLAYRGDPRLADDPTIEWCMGYYFREDPSVVDGGSDTAAGTHRLVPGNLSSRMALDRTAAEAIHLLPPRTGLGAALLTGGNASNNSLFGALNRCLTKMGARTLEVWLRQPLVDVREINRRHEAVAALLEDGLGRQRLRDEGLTAARTVDLDALGHRLTAAAPKCNGGESGGLSSSKALGALYKLHLFADICLPPLLEALGDFLASAPRVVPTLGDDDDADNDGCALRSIHRSLEKTRLDLEKAVGLAENVIDFDAAPRNFLVRTEVDSSLEDVKEELDGVQAELEDLHAEMNDLWREVSGRDGDGVKMEDVDSNSNTECMWQFRLPKTNDTKLLQDRLGEQVNIHRILKNGVYFSTKPLVQLGLKKRDLMSEYEEKQRSIVGNVMDVAVTFVPVLERAALAVAELDVLAGFAEAAANAPNGGYVRPEMTDGEEDGLGIELKDARHPCVELQENVDFIGNDISLVFGSSSFLLVTGPNMGGKSTYIRSLGAIVTMAQIGSFVPCSSAKINVVHHILARVGAGDAQGRGISTFMAEMLEASSILRTATKRSLIIVDELGRGTSTFDGFGLAKAISEHIVQEIGCLTVFATHFHELTALEEEEAAVKNCHVTAQSDGKNGLTFLYEVRPGPCLESFGIQVAEMANMPKEIITDAKRKAKQLENFDYRKKSKAAAADDDEQVGGIDDHETSERTAEIMECLHKFRRLPLDTMSEEEAHKTVLQLFTQYGYIPSE